MAKVFVAGIVIAVEAESDEEVKNLLERVIDNGFFQEGDYRYDWGYFPHGPRGWCYPVEREYPESWDIDTVLLEGRES